MIYTPDREALFVRICGYFERAGFNIVEAKIHTTRDRLRAGQRSWSWARARARITAT